MSSHAEGKNTSNGKEGRKIRQQKVRSSPNSKLLNAAWPKAPTAPTRRNQIKAVNRGGFGKPWNEWGQQSPGVEESSIEDMEVDIVADDEVANTSKSSNKKDSVEISAIAVEPDSPENLIPEVKHAHADKKPSEDRCIILKAKHSLNDLPTTAGGVSHRRVTRCSNKLEKEGNSKTSANKSKDVVEKMKVDSMKRKDKQPLFIIIHANKVELGDVKGPATSPVKVYAEKFMIKMEDESTKKEISFRVPCKKITSLDISFLKKPFMIKFKASEIQYLSGVKSHKSKGQSIDTVVLHLGHEESVPLDVQNDLKELFAVRLAELFLWPDKYESMVAIDEMKKDKPEENSSNSKNEGLVKSSSCNKNVATESFKCKKKTVKESSKIDKLIDDCDQVDNRIAKNDKDAEIASVREIGRKKETLIAPSVISVRKRSPYRSKSETDTHSSLKDDVNAAKYPRRCHFEMNESLEEQVKTYSHEAAHYQSISAQQRMIIQSLEEDIQRRTIDSERRYDEILNELDGANKALSSKNLEIGNLSNDFTLERDLVKALEDRIDSMRQELIEKDMSIAEKISAIQVRNETIEELHATINRQKENDGTDPEDAVSSSTMEETRQNLMQMQVSKNNLSVELEEMRSSLVEKNREFENLTLQLNGVRNDLRNKDESLLQLRSDFIASQEELVRKNERIRYLNEQLARSNDGSEEVIELRHQLSSTISQLDDVNSELTEVKARLVEIENIGNEGQSSVPNDWVIERGEISFQDGILGVGAWGNVKKGKFRGTDVAVKQIHLLILSPHNRKLFEREMSIASRCRHPCLVQFIGATNDDGTPIFVMELLETDLRSLLSRQSLNDQECVQLGFDIIRALTYLHQSKPTPIIHRDISSSNVLLYRGNSKWRAKLSDYGAANFMRLAMTRHPGAFLYSAPEASTVNQTTKLDVYSFGVLFCEMCIRELPMPENRQQQVESVENIDRKSLIKNCLKRNISRRLDSTSVLHVFECWNGVEKQT